MYKFMNKEYDVLLCTTIIETGIDIPNANTLIIIDADRYGLSQLYQIRGRVGRSNKIAYSYLMYNKGKILSDIAKKRLNVIKEFTELGSGFSIAMRDLSIRGAGDILGREQSGFIDTIGIDLYLRMLNEEINRRKDAYADYANYMKACSLYDYLLQELLTNESLRTLNRIVKDTHIENSELRLQPLNKKWGIIGLFEIFAAYNNF